MSDLPASNARIRVEWDLSREGVTVRYEVENLDRSFALFSFDADGSSSGEAADLTDRLLIRFEPPATLRLRRAPVPPPTGVVVGAILLPALHRTGPGERSRASFRLSSPLREANAFFPHFAGAQYRTEQVRSLVLEVGYVRESPRLAPISLSPDGSIVRLLSPVRDQHVLQATTSESVSILVRREDYFRRE